MRYTEEEFVKVKGLERDMLKYARGEIIGKYEFCHEAFGGKTAHFVRNSFTENLRYGTAFYDKVEVLKNIKTVLQKITYNRYEKNMKPSQKPKVNGYYVFSGIYNNKEVEYYFEDKSEGDGGLVFYFIKIGLMVTNPSSCEGRPSNPINYEK